MMTLSGSRLACALALAAAVLLVRPPAVRADLIPCSPVPAHPVASADRETVGARLVESGLAPEEAGARVAALDEQELAMLADNPEQLQLAGGGVTIGLMVLGAAIVIFVVLWLIGTEKINL